MTQEQTELLQQLLAMVAALLEKKDKGIGAMSEDAFTDLLLKITDTKQYLAAKREMEITTRIFADVEGVTTATTPFRVTSRADVDKLTTMLKNGFDGGAKAYAVAVALIDGDTYAEAKR